jgi:phosphoglycolate phosphatase
MKTFDLLRKNGTKIENEFQANNSGILGVIFSGFGYTYRNPLLYYPLNILFDHNIDYLGVDYRYYNDENFMKLNDEEQNKYFEEDTKIVLNKILEINKNYKKIILIGKSLGTTAINLCLKNEQLKNKSSIIFITPENEWANIINDIKDIQNKILVIGSFQDKYYTVKNLAEIYDKNNIKTYELKYGDHSLSINDTIKDIEQLKAIMEKIKQFIEENI